MNPIFELLSHMLDKGEADVNQAKADALEMEIIENEIDPNIEIDRLLEAKIFNS
jgi:hypothetical protein